MLKSSGRVRKQVWVIACISLTLVTVGVVLGMPLWLHPLSVAITIVATLVWDKVLYRGEGYGDAASKNVAITYVVVFGILLILALVLMIW